MNWLARVPQEVVRAHLVMLPRLQAEEALDAMGSGAIAQRMDGVWAGRHLRILKRQVAGDRFDKGRANVEDLIQVGIGVRVVPRG